MRHFEGTLLGSWGVGLMLLRTGWLPFVCYLVDSITVEYEDDYLQYNNCYTLLWPWSNPSHLGHLCCFDQ